VNRMVDCVLSLDLEPNRLADFCKGREGDRLDWWVSVGMLWSCMQGRAGGTAPGDKSPASVGGSSVLTRVWHGGEQSAACALLRLVRGVRKDNAL
jgi:hypothetical protein